MPDEERRSRSDRERRERPREGEESRRSGREREGRERRTDPSDAAKNAAQVVKDTAKTATNAVKTGAETVSGAMDGAVELVGGYRGIDKMIKKYNRAFYDFANESFLNKIGLTDRPSKFLIFLIGVGIIQSILPILGLFMSLFARLLGFLFIFNNGKKELVTGFKRSSGATKVKSLLVAFLICSAFDIVPTFLFDSSYHFGALWAFMLPVILFVTPLEDQPDQTIAVIICDLVYAPLASAVEGFMPDVLKGEMSEGMAWALGCVVGLLFWIGYLGATGSFLVVWCYLAYQTAIAVGSPIRGSDSSRYVPQMTVWHNLLAIWLWRYLISAIESIEIPGLISVVGLIVNYIPTYFIWITALMFGMLITRKTEKRMRANTWYASWIMGGASEAVKSTSEARPSSSSRPTSSPRPSSRKPGESRPKEGEERRK